MGIPSSKSAPSPKSTANDLLTFLAAALGDMASPFDRAFSIMRATRKPASVPDLETGLGWQVLTRGGAEIVWHNGGTGGYGACMGYDAHSRTGVVVLANAGTPEGSDDIAHHLLDPSAPLLQTFTPAAPRRESTVDVARFDHHVGRYQIAPSVFLTVRRDGSRFFAQLTGQPAFEIFAESGTDYFFKIVDAQLTFEIDAQRRTVAVVLHQDGVDQRAPRIASAPAAARRFTSIPVS
jgi:hypothetical protein